MPSVHAAAAKTLFRTLHGAIAAGLVRSCHDLSEGGLSVAVAEMAFAGGYGAEIDVNLAPQELIGLNEPARIVALLFSESNTRFVCEVTPENQVAFESLLRGTTCRTARIGSVQASDRLVLWASESRGTAAARQRVPCRTEGSLAVAVTLVTVPHSIAPCELARGSVRLVS